MTLPTCECVAELSQAWKLNAIYCALLQIAQGGGGGNITLSQITDLDPSWIPILQAPAGSFTITAGQISDATNLGRSLIMLTNPPAASIIKVADNGVVSYIAGQDNVGLTPVNSITTDTGVITSAT